jgi:hypothetical protein
MPVLSVSLAVIALALGALAEKLTQKAQAITGLVMGLARGMVAVLLLAHVLPELVTEIGPWALVLAGAGALAPLLGASLLQKPGVTLLIMMGLAIHALLDGVALGLVDQGEERLPLTIAIVTHRLPLALFLCSYLARSQSRLGPWAGVSILAVATVIGALGGAALDPVSLLGSVLLAVVAGMLLHVLFHSRQTTCSPRMETIGLLAGLVLGLLVPHA